MAFVTKEAGAMRVSGTVCLVGCGKMGGALLAGWLRGDAAEALVVIEPQPLPAALREQIATHGRTRVVADAGAVGAGTDADAGSGAGPGVVVLAVKPQAMAAVLPGLRPLVGPGTVFLSIAAGRTLGWLSEQLGPGARIVRSMPNTPAAVGCGMTVAVAGAEVTAEQVRACEHLLAAVGEVAWVTDESLMDAVTAVSGSGPAYVFLLIEAMAQAGVACGLPEALAGQLARATVIGSGELARRSDEPAATLRQNVTSPGGTTAAALEILMAPEAAGGGLPALMTRAVEAAARRSRALAG